ncbi:DNA-processing protein DprA [Dokdonella koreensis]|uniref:DNA protecting protein DprA n=1 Tax=Dokdonella koreensis DS-123 TaxID=1300342 RepID=A0A167GFF5_9GAMM|nr:DNA-processing protein DprA [Dokdonella koreensis]ANB16498.1 DNA protecting protein DprA [Dokdonella koreensis DS-123]
MDANTVDTEAWLTLVRAPGLGAARLRRLLDRHGRVADALEAVRRGGEDIGEAACAWARAPDAAAIAADRAWLAAPQHHLLVADDEDFPPLLRDIPGAPIALFVVGEPTRLWMPQVAVVGSRNASAGGLATARSFARALAGAGFTVTSGLAEGIDGAAHAAALDAGGCTIAVLGTGPDRLYPRQHRELAGRIAAAGVLVTEFPPGTTGRPEHFPRRNRIIAGLSLGTLVVEAGIKSGSLITARYAMEQGREVFAIPGSIHNPLARGCHQLIRDGAKLTETVEELIGELAPLAGELGDRLRGRLAAASLAAPPAAPAPAGRRSDPDYHNLLGALGHDPVTIDELALRTGLPVPALSSMLLVLELEGEVDAGSGGVYSRQMPP